MAAGWLYTALYIVLTTVLTLPWSAYEGFFREHQYGMSNQTVFGWLTDQFKGLAMTLVLVPASFAVLYAVVRKSTRNWWLWGALVAMVLLAFQLLIGPAYLEPVFNKFYPLAESPLKQQLLSLARANEIPAQQIYEFDASKQTTKMSAHVSGLLGSAQISLNDNLINRASPEEVEAVVGHEMGHYVLNHEYKGMLAIGIVVIVGFAFLSWSFDRLSRRYAQAWGIRGIADVAGLPLLVALFSVYLFVLTPVLNTITRNMEIEAEFYGLNASRQPDGFAQAALHLSEYRKMQPGAAGGRSVLRSSERLEPHPSGDGLEGREHQRRGYRQLRREPSPAGNDAVDGAQGGAGSLHPVDEDEQPQPHHVDEVPVPGHRLEGEVLARREVAAAGCAAR